MRGKRVNAKSKSKWKVFSLGIKTRIHGGGALVHPRETMPLSDKERASNAAEQACSRSLNENQRPPEHKPRSGVEEKRRVASLARFYLRIP